MKKLALILFGISYHEDFNHYSNKNTIIDFRLSYDNYREYIYKYFNNLGYEIDVYFATNIIDNEYIKNQLLDIYKPIKYIFMENNKDFHFSRNIKVKSAIECVLESNIEYEICLITRFDLLFQKNFNEHNIILNEFNIISELYNESLICDNFYLFPYNLLNKFYEIVNKNIKISFHKIKNDIEKISNINYILNEKTLGENLTFYKINRQYNGKNTIYVPVIKIINKKIIGLLKTKYKK